MADQEWSEIQQIRDNSERADAISHKIDEMVANNDADVQSLIWEKQQQNYEDEKQRLRENARSGDPISSQMQSSPGVGKFYVPTQNSFAAHRQIVCSEKYNLGFSPKKYPQFDGVIEMTFNNLAVTNENHRDHAKYEGVRDNIAVLRNYILTQMFPEGSAENPTKEQLQLLTTMANEVGNALQADRQWIHTPWRYVVKLDKANEPGTGAAYMYETLLQIQKRSLTTGPLDALAVVINLVRRRPTRKFGLPELQDSPFSDGGLSAPPPIFTGNGPDSPSPASVVPEQDSPGILLAEIAAEIGARAQRFEDVESLDEPIRREAIEQARNILENFRIAGEKSGVAEMMLQSTESKITQADSISVLTSAFEQAVRKAAINDHTFMKRPEIIEARDAMGHLAWFMNVQALDALKQEEHFGAAKIVAQQIKAFPDEWRQHPEITLQEILAKIEAGLDVADTELTLSQHYFVNDERLKPFSSLAQKMTGNVAPTVQAPQTAQKMQQKAVNDLTMDAQAVTKNVDVKATADKRDSTRVGKNSSAASEVDKLFSKNGDFKNIVSTGSKMTGSKAVAPTKLDDSLTLASSQVVKR